VQAKGARNVNALDVRTITRNLGGATGELVGLPVSDGSDDFLVVEVDEEEPSGGLVLAAAPDPAKGPKGIAKAQVTLEQALGSLKPSRQKITEVLKELAPEESEVEFGLKIGGETGVIVAKGTAEVNFVVRMTWKAAEPKTSGKASAVG
jgi:hypothetical protein